MNWSTLTFGAALTASAQQFPERIAVVDGTQRITFRELDDQVTALAHGLQEQGIGKGDQVAVWMTNCTWWVISWVACTRIGAVVVPINTRYKLDEVAYILKQSDARAWILMDKFWDIDFLGVARQIIPEIDHAKRGKISSPQFPALQNVILWKSAQAPGLINLEEVRDRGRILMQDTSVSLPISVPTDPIIIVYTSGTTGHPKGAMHSHILLRNVANVARVMHVVPGDVVLGHMPFKFSNWFAFVITQNILRRIKLTERRGSSGFCHAIDRLQSTELEFVSCCHCYIWCYRCATDPS